MLPPMTSIEEILLGEDGARRAGATDDQNVEAEQRIGITFPEDFRAFLRWSNGWSGMFARWPLIVVGTDDMPHVNAEAFQEFFRMPGSWRQLRNRDLRCAEAPDDDRYRRATDRWIPLVRLIPVGDGS